MISGLNKGSMHSVGFLRNLPIRWAELGTVYRYERSGTLHGLMRVRGFTQDDAHIFCLPEQVEDEIIKVLDLTEAILGRFGFNRREDRAMLYGVVLPRLRFYLLPIDGSCIR